MTSFVFIILHYKTIEDTKKSLESIRIFINKDKDLDIKCNVVVIDNGSNDNLLKDYIQRSSIKEITLLNNKKNLGFSRGNNVGFIYALKYFNPDFVVLMNNDVEFVEYDFERKVIEEYKKSLFAVMGPMIINKTGNCFCNPVRLFPWTIEEIDREIQESKKWMRICKFNLDKLLILTKNLKTTLKAQPLIPSNKFLERQKNVQLHGSFMVFSKEYFSKFNGLDDSTFLYKEEEILYTHLINNNLTSIYNPFIKVYHKEDSSTNATIKSSKISLFKIKHSLESMIQFRRVFTNYESKNHKTS